jgi:hypothetical protein
MLPQELRGHAEKVKFFTRESIRGQPKCRTSVVAPTDDD